jgi:hypothetical protein
MRTTLLDKQRILEMSNSGYSSPYIATQLGLGIHVVRKWRQRGQQGKTLCPLQGRPKSGVLGSFDSLIREKIDKYRPHTEGWGALTIRTELSFESDLAGKKLPCQSSIGSYLQATGKTRRYKQSSELPCHPCYPPAFVHDLWQMDAEGNKKVEGLGTVCMINLKDSASKTYVGTLPFVFEKACNHPQKFHYQTLLRMAFMEFGMNHRLQLDHESVFFDNQSTTPYPTEFYLWLLGLGITVCFTPKGRPQQQGMVERAHQTMHQQVTAGQSFENYQQLFDRCQQRRHRLNYDIPSKSTQNLAPLVACPQAIRSQRPYLFDQEEAIFDPKRIQTFLEQGRWLRNVSKDRTVSLGGKVYYLPNAVPNAEVRIKYDAANNEFHFFDADQLLINQRPAKGLTFKELAPDFDTSIAFLQQLMTKST